mmetsp:Transcript_3993/g.5800  ORF Transcript_3993/g.5800 Transcript_3993/m.5800 type:complete len:92 (-) Transcript_3993:276-551(-)
MLTISFYKLTTIVQAAATAMHFDSHTPDTLQRTLQHASNPYTAARFESDALRLLGSVEFESNISSNQKNPNPTHSISKSLHRIQYTLFPHP